MPATPKTPRSRVDTKPYIIPTPPPTRHRSQSRQHLSKSADVSSSSEEVSSGYQPDTPHKDIHDYPADVKPHLDDDDEDFFASKGGKSQPTGKKGRGTGFKAKVTKMPGGGSGSGGKAGAWTADETWQLFLMMHPRTDKPLWAEIAKMVGRDSKSCQNRYALVSKKWEAAIKSFA